MQRVTIANFWSAPAEQSRFGALVIRKKERGQAPFLTAVDSVDSDSNPGSIKFDWEYCSQEGACPRSFFFRRLKRRCHHPFACGAHHSYSIRFGLFRYGAI